MHAKRRLLTTGPVSMPEELRLSMALDNIHPGQEGFAELLDAVMQGLRELLRTSGPVIPLACDETGAMAAAVRALFREREKIIVIESGETGERWSEIVSAARLDAVLFKTPWNEPLAPERLEQAMDMEPEARAVLLSAADLSTGVMQPLGLLAEKAHRRGMLLAAEATGALGVSPCFLDVSGVDCLTAGCHFGLMLPPGLSVAALSEQAWERAREVRSGDAHLNLLAEREALESGAWSARTLPVNQLVGLHASLSLLLAQGPDRVFRKHYALSRMARAGLTALGLHPAVAKGFAWGATSFRLPAGLDRVCLLEAAMRDYGVILSGGWKVQGGRAPVMGHAGNVDYGDVLAGLSALAGCLADCGGFSASRDYLEQALAVWKKAALEETGAAM
jgi:aspartate aminotransferase-like enzyme